MQSWCGPARRSIVQIRRQLNVTTSDRSLAIFLRVVGTSALLSIGAVVMPFAWMTAIHRGLGLGDMPDAPVVEYLARTVSAFYAFFGAVCLIAASDLERYRSLAWFVGAALAVMGATFFVVDVVAGMPEWWCAVEGPLTVLLGGVIALLSR